MKGVVNPLLWLLVAQIWCWWVLRRNSGGRAKAASTVLLGSALLLWLIATQPFSQAVERIWSLPPASIESFRPTHLLVLAGGWRRGETSEEDFLGHETQRRVLHAAVLWRRYPESRLVMSGWTGGRLARNAARQVELMAEVARQQGVPASAIVLEPRAASTSEHPIEVLKLPGLRPDTPVGIVTSGWHMRRARAEFSRYFENVALYPVALLRRPTSWEDFMPTVGALGDSVTVLHEAAGMAWYWLREPARW
jgi:uncharacterized SAM-binding protein YcdF (DUF218 family)